MRPASILILSCGLLSLAAAPDRAVPEDRAIVRGLVRNAWFWQARARADKAEEVWRSVLATDPDQPDAVAAVAGFDARAGREQTARGALDRLKKIAPDHPDIRVLEHEIALGPRLGDLLAKARQLVHGGHVDQGIAQYRDLFSASGPPGDLALEYFETIAGTDAGWSEARAGLQQLVERVPGESRFRLVLAKLLTYRDRTRRQGIEMLTSLSRDPAVSKEATTRWRESLLWLGDSPEDLPLFRRYLGVHPGDRAVAQVMESARRAGITAKGYAALERGDTSSARDLFAAAGDTPESRRGQAILRERVAQEQRKQAFAALERGAVDVAERLFERSGNGPEARLGLALVAQRRAADAQRDRDFPRARALLERARELAPQRSDVWEPALRSVQFWTLVDRARVQRQAGRTEDAERTLHDALRDAPAGERWNAELPLADLRMARGDRDGASALYRGVLDRVPRQADALRGLTSVLIASGRFDEALATNETLLQVAPDKAYRSAWLRAEAWRSRAARSSRSNDLATARKQLETARREDPSDVWVLLDLANVLLASGDTVAATPVTAALLAAAPGMPEAWSAQARLLAARGESARALDLLARLPQVEHDPDLHALRRRLEVEVRVPAILQQARGGARGAAVQQLLALEHEVEDEPLLAGRVAVAWSQLGELGRAVRLMRSAMERAPGETRGLRLELASTLLQAGDDQDAEALLEGLERDPRLTPDERRSLADLRISRAVRVADLSRSSGEKARASAALAPVRRDYPDDPRVLAAVGRLLEGDDPEHAHVAYVRALRAAPDDMDARRGAVDTALAAGDEGEASAFADEAVQRAPRDARSYLLVGRVAARRREDARAMQALRQAEAMADAPPDDPTRVAVGQVANADRTVASPAEGTIRRAASVGSDPPVDPPTRSAIRDEISMIRERHQPSLVASGDARRREGESGLSGLSEYTQTLQAEIPINYGLRGWLRATELELDAGTVASSASSRFGRGVELRSSVALRAYGTAIAAGFEGRDIVGEASTTPLGFPVQSFLGALRLRHAFGPLRLAIEGARRSVTDSLLSHAGVADPTTGQVWGGVVSQGGRSEIGLEFSRARLLVYGSYDWLVGVRVAQNRRAVAGARAEFVLLRGSAGDVSVGLSGVGMRYDLNLRYFTQGHGGYFSPQQFVRGGLPVGWRREGRVRWELVAEPGLEWFKEASAPAFPGVGTTAPGDQHGVSAYQGQIVRGFAFEGRAALGWVIARQIELRATAAVQQAPEYRELRAGLLLRFGGLP